MNHLCHSAFLLFLFICCDAFALEELEIQCNTPRNDYDFVLKRSPDSQISYALLFTPEQLETYINLKDSFILIESDESFHYFDQEKSQEIFVDLKSGQGNFKLGWNQFNTEEVILSNCHSTLF